MTLPRKPISPTFRGLAPTTRLAKALAAKPVTRSNGLMPRSATATHPGLRDFARTLADTPGKRLAKALAPVNRVSEALAPVNRVSEALAPVNRVSEALAPVNRLGEAISPITQLGEVFAPLRLGPPLPPLFDDQPCDEPQMETRLVRVSGTREAWADYYRDLPVVLTRC